MPSAEGVSFVCCVESGALEAQTVWMVESLRKFGGGLSDAPVFAVNPRMGSPLSGRTLKQFGELGVTYIRCWQSTPYSWFKFLNKPLALIAAEKHITSESVCWLDSDLLFVDEPEKLRLEPGEDFVGFPAEDKEMGTTGSGDPYEQIWREFCHLLDIDIESLPWVTTAESHDRIRLYFNGGIFAYRRATGFAREYHRICLQLLDSGIGTNAAGYNVGLKEMSAIGFAVAKMGLSWRALPYSHDYVMSSFTHTRWYREDLLRAAKVVHYHDAMWPKFWDVFLKCIQDTHPQVADWLGALGPMHNYALIHWKAVNRLLRKHRARAEQAYNASCKIAGTQEPRRSQDALLSRSRAEQT